MSDEEEEESINRVLLKQATQFLIAIKGPAAICKLYNKEKKKKIIIH